MKSNIPFNMAVRILSYCIVAALPLLHEYGQLYVLAVACAVTIYEGARSTVVYEMIALLVSVEIIYGTPVGVMSISYIISVVLFMLFRRFIAVHAWSAQEGWRISDAIRTVVVAVLLYTAILVLAVFVAAVLYRTGYEIDRVQNLWNSRLFLLPLIVSVLTCLLIRRISVPFRREILFGT